MVGQEVLGSEGVERVVGKIVLDGKFRADFIADPVQVLDSLALKPGERQFLASVATAEAVGKLESFEPSPGSLYDWAS